MYLVVFTAFISHDVTCFQCNTMLDACNIRNEVICYIYSITKLRHNIYRLVLHFSISCDKKNLTLFCHFNFYRTWLTQCYLKLTILLNSCDKS